MAMVALMLVRMRLAAFRVRMKINIIVLSLVSDFRGDRPGDRSAQREPQKGDGQNVRKGGANHTQEG